MQHLTPCCPRPVWLAVMSVCLMCSIQSHAAEPIQWRTDYNAARKESQDTGKPLLVEIGTDNCLYCRKMEATTFTDPAIVELLNSYYIPLKINASHDNTLVQALRVQLYPTTVLAGPDGKIHSFLQGYMAAAQLKDHVERTVLAVTTPDWVARDLHEANKAIATGDYTRAVSLLKGITQEAKASPAKTKASQVLAEVEQSAADRLARAIVLERQGETAAAMDVLSELMRNYGGTIAARDASDRLSGLAQRGGADRLRSARARDLLALARDEFRHERFADCLDHCEMLASRYADLPESQEATILAKQVKADPDRLAAACEQLNERAAAMHLALADVWLTKGQVREATICLEKVSRTWPNTRQAEVALAQLQKLQRGDGTFQAGFEKK